MSGAFDWESDPSVVVKEQPGIAVYINARGDVLIRDSDWNMIGIAPEHVHAVAAAMVALVPKDRTAAERQRRYRERRKRDASPQALRDVTRDSVTDQLPFSAAAE